MSEQSRDLCPFCEKGHMVPSKVRVAIAGLSVGAYDGLRCDHCGEEFLREHSLRPAHEEIVKSGLFGVARIRSSQSPSISAFVLESGTTSNPVQGTAFLETSGTDTGSRSVITTLSKMKTP